MAWDRGERGSRSEYFSRGRGPARDLRDEQDDRYDYRGGEDQDDDARYARPYERRHWRGSEYEGARDVSERGRDRERDDDDFAGRFIDRRHRHGFLRGESQERHEQRGGRSADDWRGREGIGDQDRWSGPYAGRGPKNYRRSDERILEDVCERLMEHPTIDASEVEVAVKDGDVTLSGTVENRAVKHLTEVMAETVNGVKEVHNQLRIAKPTSAGAASLPDDAIYRQRR